MVKRRLCTVNYKLLNLYYQSTIHAALYKIPETPGVLVRLFAKLCQTL